MLTSFLYQYLVAGLVFAFGIFCGIRNGSLDPRDFHGRRRLTWLCGGFVFLFCLQGATLIWGK